MQNQNESNHNEYSVIEFHFSGIPIFQFSIRKDDANNYFFLESQDSLIIDNFQTGGWVSAHFFDHMTKRFIKHMIEIVYIRPYPNQSKRNCMIGFRLKDKY